ncbi:hypothetical protein QJS10_CPB15g01675 [Acorus calamus]|uniref:Uncharacterized protein n=1 Tax=Acorus calamus TaxID=4465 RepID=A0AAV9D5E9_ACOCL|nr:hypothetical protein QJS10_CPB15g01675 [Acorus calamus]
MGKNQPWLPLILINLSLITCFAEDRAIYMVLMEGEPVAFHEHGTIIDPDSESAKAHEKHLVESHDRILESSLEAGNYNKLYSFHHIVNGFAVHTTPSQAKKLEKADGVTWVEKDRGVKLKTTYSPHFLHLTEAVWATGGGERNAGEGIVIGFIDTGIDPTHPSFSYDPLAPYRVNPARFRGVCESGPHFQGGLCNGKIVSARYFSAGAASIMPLNTSRDFLSPFDAIGHGRIAVYKAIYPDVGTLADVVSAIDQATRDGVDVLTLSIGPDEPPTETPTFLSVLDMFLLYARKAGVFVVQAAGNKGPGPATVSLSDLG